MIIQTERLTLRPFTMRDLKTTHIYASDAENTQYMGNLSNKTKTKWATWWFLKHAIAQWKRKPQRRYDFAIDLAGKHIGSVSVSLDESGQKGALGWIIQKAHWGNGYATEAAKAVMEFARGLGATMFLARCDERNEASRRVMEKIGMTLESGDSTCRYKDVRDLIYST